MHNSKRSLPPTDKHVITIRDHIKKIRFSSSLPYLFTEHGAIMLANVINSPEPLKRVNIDSNIMSHLRVAAPQLNSFTQNDSE